MGFIKRRPKRETRIFFTTDVHGSDRCFVKFLNAAKTYDADVLLLGGDITGKRIVPMIADGSGTFHSNYAGQPVELSSAEALAEFEQATANAGLYAYRTDEEEVRTFSDNSESVDAVFRKLAAERLERWMTWAEERLDPSRTRIFVNCGNDDPFELDAIIDGSPLVAFPEGRALPLDERRTLVSCGFANDTPWHCERDVSEEDLAARIEAAIAAANGSAGQLVLNLHAPPHNSGLDLCPVLADDLKPVMAGGQPVMGPVGSTAVREAIERHRPILSLHGHVHESRGVAEIGPTLAVNPGSEYPEGVLRGVVVDLGEPGVLSHVLTSG